MICVFHYVDYLMAFEVFFPLNMCIRNVYLTRISDSGLYFPWDLFKRLQE